MKFRLAVVLLAVVLLGALIAFSRPKRLPPEPSYAGRTLSQWLELNPNAITGNPRSREAREAILKMGTNALPCLLSWLSADPDHNPAKQVANSALNGLPEAVTPRKAREWAESDWVAVHLEMAPLAFAVLGSNAAPAIPALERLASDRRGRRSAHFATYILGGIGPQALPALQRIAQNPACPTHTEAAREIAAQLNRSRRDALGSH